MACHMPEVIDALMCSGDTGASWAFIPPVSGPGR